MATAIPLLLELQTLCSKRQRKYERTHQTYKSKKAAHICSILKQFFACPVFVPRTKKKGQAKLADSHLKTTYHPSGRYLLTIRGIFFWLSSLIAICKGSVSPSRSTSTGAFMLNKEAPVSKRRANSILQTTNLICKALVPKTRALSYLVI